MRILIIILGLIFGSLGSVVMTRFSDGVTRAKLRGFFFGYSQCPDCKHTLKAKNLVPVVSYLIQGGKCEYCKKKISRIYPALEVLCAGIFVLTYFLLKDFGTPTLIFGLLTNRLLIILLVYDLKEYELHMIARILLMTVGILANILISGGNLRNAFFFAIVFGGVFMLIYFFAKRYAKMRFKKTMEGFGEGDVYLAVAVGILLPIVLSLAPYEATGFHHLSFSRMMLAKTLILFVILSSIIGLIWAGLQYIFQKIFHNSEFCILHSALNIIPFFPAMIIAFRLLAWKLGFFISLLFPLAG